MPWFKVDPRMGAHPGSLKAGPEAFGYWIQLGCWLAQFPDEAPVIPDVIAYRLNSGRPRRRNVERLVNAGLLVPTEGGFILRERMNFAGSGLTDRAWGLDTSDDRRSRIPVRVRRLVYARDGHACVECEAVDDLSLDHIIPWSKGGSDAPENLRTLCRSCNSSKGDRL